MKLEALLQFTIEDDEIIEISMTTDTGAKIEVAQRLDVGPVALFFSEFVATRIPHLLGMRSMPND